MLSPALFKLYMYINDLPKYLQGTPDEVLLNPVQCLMYADDIVLLSSSRKGYKAD